MKLDILGQFAAACLLLLGLTPNANGGENKLVFTVLNLPDIQAGAGLAIVMQTPNGSTWLYDTGLGYPAKLSSDGWKGNFNAGRDIIAPFLKKRNISGIDGVLMSHAHFDHFGGLLWLKDHFPVKRLIDCGYVFRSGNPGDSAGTASGELGQYETIREEFKKRGTHQAMTAGELLQIDPALKVEVIAPPKDYFKDPQASTRQAGDGPSHYLVNANSLALRIQHGDIVFYLPGDIQTEDLDMSLLPTVDHAKLKCHILVAPGHGIHCTPKFAEVTRPEVSVASVFPRYAKGLKSTPMLKAVGARTLITGIDGDVEIVSDGRSYQVKTTGLESSAAAKQN